MKRPKTHVGLPGRCSRIYHPKSPGKALELARFFQSLNSLPPDNIFAVSLDPDNMKTDTNLIGVYTVDGQTDVHLLELKIDASHTDIEIGEFTQQQNGIDQLDWQTPWDEKYLNEEGTEIIGDWLDAPANITGITRLVFFLHSLDFGKSLVTPFGEIDIIQPIPMPERLSSIINYEEPD